MIRRASFAIACATLAALPAQATIVGSNGLADLNSSSLGMTTVTGPNGRVTTVTGGTRYENPLAPKDVWQQQNVGAGGSVGITTEFAKSGNGSLVFGGTGSSSKADAEIYFSTPIALSSLTSASYDAFRATVSANPAHQINSLRFIIGNAAGNYLAYLIYEPVYNGYPTANPVPENSWLTFSIDSTSKLWSNNNLLGKPSGTPACSSCYLTLAQWQASNTDATIIGLSTGSGSGFNGVYKGAVDNISFTAGSVTRSYNFEASPAPEPASWAMMIGGFGMIGAVARRRRAAAATA